MSSAGSITFWLDQLKAGTPDAVQPIWNRYFAQLVRLARRRLEGAPRAAADEDDIALSAFKSFCHAVEKGRYPNLQDRDDLWKLLAVIAERKAFNLRRDQARLKRGGGMAAIDIDGDMPGLGDLPGSEPTPFFAAVMAEECARLLALLGSETLRQVALDKMEGFGNEEIAGRRGMALRTVERKLALIRQMWEQVAPARSSGG